ncbi:M-phase phosphoprotein 6 isoform X2 [Ooceraea biroi]|uniref:M-phase phosphoprotein n=1 Tax=Ooceraea biroi TaxID=2015173 RepID=A0A026WE09_OOCBI|nr:M-phase phosphoprotein 6 isoform X2 [Ooceraea biroi]EZA54340.1 M-phase phosphoprotein [Ooceraea biroi]
MDNKRVALSKSILEMKFMKRTKDKVEKEQFEEEGEEYFGSQLKSRMKKTSKFLVEPSYVFCEGLTDGRLSFQGMNPAIEKLMEARDNARARTEVKPEADISDEQMTVTWQKMRAKFDAVKKLRKSQHRKTKTEDEPVEKKLKFLKPVD